jgi:hypothetical protein
MAALTAFFAYPSEPREIGVVIEPAVAQARKFAGDLRVTTWRETDIAGRFIAGEVLENVDNTDCLIADVSRLNFNVTYEVGYAIGRGRRIVLVRNASIQNDSALRREVGIFDTLGYAEYENSAQLVDIMKGVSDITPLSFDASAINTKAPVYLLEAKFKTNEVTRMIARVKRARLFFRSFDPNEQPRLSGHDAINSVAQSAGVLLHLLPSTQHGADVHNFRAAFLAGLSQGMGKVTTILQQGTEPVPLDYRDLITPFQRLEQIDEAIGNFAVRVVEALQTGIPSSLPESKSALASLSLGASSAENELRDLGSYYLQTDQFLRALRGEARLVVGRKGSGKTAVFAQVRDRTRVKKQNIVVDLKPEGYKLKKFKETIAGMLTEGTLEHTITAFAEYLLLLEICYKILEKDEIPHTRNHHLYEPYRKLANLYETDEYVSEGDFSERMTILLERISKDYARRYGKQRNTVLSEAQVTELIYRHDVVKLRDQLRDYMALKGQLWLLLDNLDKGWPTHGIEAEDLIIIRALLEATRKIERDFQRADLEAYTLVFLRNDVYEILIDETPDRGKESKVVLDWTDPDLLREIIRKRLVFSGFFSESARFEEIWPQICISHIDGEESSQYLIDRCLLRPRSLIDLIGHCRARAINLQKDKIDRDDIIQGFSTFSSDLLIDISYEIRDVVPTAEDILYTFIGVSSTLSSTDYEITLLQSNISPDSVATITDILLWYGFLGVQVSDEKTEYIYSVNYDMKRLKGLIKKVGVENILYKVNPAFWPALDIH